MLKTSKIRKTSPEYLLDAFAGPEDIAGISKRVALFLDYDGTLVPITRDPANATLPIPVAGLLASLARRRGVSVCIVTGRSLSGIRRVADVRGVSYIANHGLEVWRRGSLWVHPAMEKMLPYLRKARDILKGTLTDVKGVLIEDKVYTLSVHNRCARKGSLPLIRKAVYSAALCAPLMVRRGKKVFEIRPGLEWDKGRAVMRWTGISGNPDALKIYIGDDETDEDAFRAIGRAGITVKVGRGATLAGFYLKGHKDVWAFLRALDRAFNE
jgi:trehalose-phosphatase